MAEEKSFSAKQVARRLGTEAKVLRKFLRDPKSGYEAVGQGGRYEFPESELTELKATFDAWNSGRQKRNRPTNAQRKLAEDAGITPKKRKSSRGSVAKRAQAEPSPMDEDDLMTRCRSSIGERARRHGLKPNQQGRLVKTAEEIMAEDKAWQDALASLGEAKEDPDAPGMELELEDDGDLEEDYADQQS